MKIEPSLLRCSILSCSIYSKFRNQLIIINFFFRLLSRTVDGKNDDLHSRHKSYTIDPSTRYKNIPRKIDHDRTLQMYDTDQPEKFSHLKQKFLKLKNISIQ